MIKRLWKVAFAEWKLIYTDPAAVLLLVVAGLIYAFYYPVPYVYQTVSKVPVAVVDLDNTAMSRDLTRMASAAQQIEVKSIYPDMKQAEAAMARDEIYGFMVIPENMEKDIRGKHQVTVNIFTHGAYVMFHGAIGTAFSTCALTVGATNKVKTLYNSTGGYANYVVPSVLVVILQQSLIIGICVLGGSRAHRRFRKKFRDSPVENETVAYRYFGRSLAFFVHYCSFILFYHCIVYNIFDFPRRGELLPMVVFSIVFLASVINLGMVVSQIFLRRESSMQLFLYLSIPVLFLANFSWPAYLMPRWMTAISYILPSTFAVPAWLSIEQMGADIYDVAPKLYQLAIQAVVYLILGLLLTRARDKAKIDIGDM